MFGKQNGSPPEPPPGQAPIIGAPGTQPMPTLRTFRVLRPVPTNHEEIETEILTLTCHAIAIGDDGRTVAQTWRIDPVLGPQLQVTRILVDCLDVEDVTPPAMQDAESCIVH